MRTLGNTIKAKKLIACACGCGTKIEQTDKWGRPRKYVSGHNGKKYAKKNQFKTEWVKRNRDSVNKAKSKRSKRIKIKALLENTPKKCAKCGVKYNGKNGAIFVYHHRNPAKKRFSVGHALINNAYKDVIKEIKKCDLLCSNCHLILHKGEF